MIRLPGPTRDGMEREPLPMPASNCGTMAGVENKKIRCSDCNVEVQSVSWNQKRCMLCRLAWEEKTGRQNQKKYTRANRARKRRSGLHCSRCARPTGKPGICAACSAYVLKWKASNKDKVAAIKRRRIVKFKNRRGRILQKLLKVQEGRCGRCGICATQWNLDHIIPKIKGGLDEEINFQVLCVPCNTSKGSKVVLDYLLG